MIEQILRLNPQASVLFISDPTHGDKFIFGTPEQLKHARFNSPILPAEITTAQDLLNRLDFETYEGVTRVNAGFTLATS